MKRKNIFIMLLILFILFGIGIFEYVKINNNKNTVDLDTNTNIKIDKEQVDLLQSLVGLESKDMKILDNPLRIEGNFYIPEETVLTYINHYLKKSNNKDVENTQVFINKNGMTISGQYKLLSYIKTPIDVDIIPSLSSDEDLILKIKDIKLLNLSLSDDITNAIVKSWVADLKYVIVNNEDLIIDKNIFGNATIKGIIVKENYLVVDVSVRLK